MLIVSLNSCPSGWVKILLLAFSIYNNAPQISFVDSLSTLSKQGTLPYLSCRIQFSSLLATNASQLPHVFLDLPVTLTSCKFPQGREALCDPHIQPNGSHVVLWLRAASHNEVRVPDTVPRKHSYSMAWCLWPRLMLFMVFPGAGM